jgi:hypothetical protein
MKIIFWILVCVSLYSVYKLADKSDVSKNTVDYSYLWNIKVNKTSK